MSKKKQNIIIIGGMAAGCKTAARLKRIRPDFEVTVIEKKQFVSYGSCGMPYFASGEVDAFFDLAITSWGTLRDAEFFKKAKGINILTETLVENIDVENQILSCLNIAQGKKFSLTYDKLVISTGAKPKLPPFPVPISDKISTFHNPLDAKKFRELAQTGKIGKAVIIGGGFIGCELAEAVSGLWGIETHLVEIQNHLLPSAFDREMSPFIEKTFSNNNIHLHLSSKVEKVHINTNSNPEVHLSNAEILDADYVFLCTGIEPEVSLAKNAGILIGVNGGIIVNSRMMTNIENIRAAGDCVETKSLITGFNELFPFGSIANRQGRIIADSIAGLNSEFKGAVGSISLKVFGLILASCGMTEKNAFLNLIKTRAVWGTLPDRPDYHPDSKSINAKLVYEKETLRLLGLQLAGRGEVTRYIDVFSSLLSHGATVYDLLDIEHAYTPPHSSPLNPLNSLGAMAVSQEIDGIKALNPLLFDDYHGNILDIRETSEIISNELGKKTKAFSVLEYREKINEFEKSMPLLIVCQKGSRSYEAARTFINAGFTDVKYLGGGLQFAMPEIDVEN